MPKLTINENIKSATFTVAGLAVISKLLGFLEKVVIAYFFGASKLSDVYFSTFTFFLSATFIIKEILSPTLIPNMIRAIKNSKSCAQDLFRIFFYIIFILSCLTSLLCFCFPRQLSFVIAPGFSEEVRIIQKNFIQQAAPYFLITQISILFLYILQANKRFLQASLIDIIYKAMMLASIVLLAQKYGISAIAISLGFSSAFAMLVLIKITPGSKQLLQKVTFESNSYFRSTLKLMPPIVIGVVFSHLSGLVDNIFASTFSEGSLSQLSYAKKLIDAILLIGPVSLVTVLYPNLSYLDKDSKEFKNLLNKSLKFVIFLAVPLSILLLVVGKDAISIVFERGNFDSSSTLRTFNAFAIYSCGLTVLACEPIIVHAFFARGDTKTPIFWGVVCVIINIVITFILIRHLGYLGIPLAFAISKSIKIITLCFALEPVRDTHKSMLLFIGKLAIASGVSALVILTIDKFSLCNSSLNKTINLGLKGSIFLITYLATCYKVMQIEESKESLKLLYSFRRSNNG